MDVSERPETFQDGVDRSGVEARSIFLAFKENDKKKDLALFP